MANLQWLKLSTSFFDNNKIKLLESEKDGDTLIRVWIQLLTIAMKFSFKLFLKLKKELWKKRIKNFPQRAKKVLWIFP